MPAESRGAASPSSMRQHNRALVLAEVAARPGCSRAQVADGVGLSRATVSALVDELIASSLVAELASDRGGRGRPAVPLVLDPQGPAAIGIELAVDHLTAVVLDLTGTVRARRTSSLPSSASTSTRPGQLATRLARLARRAVDDAGLRPAGGAVAVPGLLDLSSTIRRLPNIAAEPGRGLVDELATRLGVPFHADNEANLAAIAQSGLTSVGPDFLYVSGEIGVGAALVRDGVVYRGSHGFAGELGHTVVDPQGPRCGCGSRGCLEQYVGVRALLRAARSSSTADLIGAAGSGRAGAVRALDRAGHVLGVAVANAVNVVDVPAVVLGGAYARLHPWLAQPVTDELAARVTGRGLVETTVLRSDLGPDAAAIGAGLSVRDHIIATAR